MKRNFLRGFWLPVFLLTMLSLLVLPAGAEQTEWLFESAYVLDSLESGDLEKYLTDPLDDFSGHWEFAGDAENPGKSSLGNLAVLYTDDVSRENGYMEFQYLDGTNLSRATSLAFGISIQDRTEHTGVPGETMPAGVYRVDVITVCGGQEETRTVYLEGNRWYIVYSELPRTVQHREVASVTIRVEYEADTVPVQLQMTSLCASDKDCTVVSRFYSETVEAVLGEVTAEPDCLTLRPDQGGAVHLQADMVMPGYVNGASGWYMAVQASGTVQGGEISVGVNYSRDATAAEAWFYTAALETVAGTHTYLFPLPEPDSVSLPGGYTDQTVPVPEAYQLSFQNVTGDGQASFRVEQVTCIPVFFPHWQNSGLGSMAGGVVRDGEIVWEGKLTRQAVIDYIDAEIALMAVPLWDRYNYDAAVELAGMPVSNSFRFVMPVSAMETYGAGWLFYAAIREEKATQDPEIQSVVMYTPVTCPEMLSGTAPDACNLSLFGFHAANAIGVYESNVSHVTVDVMLDQLIAETGSLVTFGGQTFALSQTYLAALDREVLFYSDAGLEVSLRLLSAKPYAWTEIKAENYLPLAETEEDLYRFAAALSALCRRYPSVASITLGKGINCEKYTGLSVEEPEELMERIAALAALTYQTARLLIPDIYVVLPFSDGHVYRSEKTLPDHGQILDPEHGVILLAAAMERLGEVPWVASWRFEDDREAPEAASVPARWRHVLQRLDLPVFDDFLYRWEPEGCLTGEPMPYDIAERYETLCRILAESDPRAVILSFARIADHVSQTMYAAVTDLPDPTGNQTAGRKVQKFSGTLQNGGSTAENYRTVVTMWDFTTAYDTAGFVAGGGIDGLYTTCSRLFDPVTGTPYSRVLRSDLPIAPYEGSTSGLSGGILLRNFEGMMDLSKVDCLQFTFVLSGQETSVTPPTVAFLIGAEDWRAEYHVTGVLDGAVMTAVCDLREYENAARTGYIGVMLYGETGLTFDLSSVQACSNSAGEEEILTLLTPETVTDSGSPYATEIFYIFVLLAVTTIFVSVLLFRREREEDEYDGKRK
ncbi:MAG: hypothetical protein E7631_05990 [Ruminococcaceae bacterium]|nr:hypothetical protein [Oscillospiraceae bacterium]